MKADSTILGHRMGNRTGIKFRGDVDGGSFGGAVQACIGKFDTLLTIVGTID